MSINQATLKQCSRKENCVNPLGSWLPATREYFYREKRRPDGLKYECKCCTIADQERWNERNADAKQQREKEYRRAHKDKIRLRRQLYYRNHLDEFKRYQSSRLEERRERQRRYYHANPNARIWRQQREARKRALPSSFSAADWRRALEYFNGCCAVCGRQLRDLLGTHTAAADHWIPLSSPDCPGTIPTNIIPLCQGLGGCNNRKSDRDPASFLSEEFGETRARSILSRITAYFELVSGEMNQTMLSEVHRTAID